MATCTSADWRDCPGCRDVDPGTLARVTARLAELGVEPLSLATSDAQRAQWEHRARALSSAVRPPPLPPVARSALAERERARRVDFFGGLRWAGVPFDTALGSISPGWQDAWGKRMDGRNRWRKHAWRVGFVCPTDLAEVLISADACAAGIGGGFCRLDIVERYIEIRRRSTPHRESLDLAMRAQGEHGIGELDMVAVGELIGLEMARCDEDLEDRIRARDAAYRTPVSGRAMVGWPTADDPWDQREAWRKAERRFAEGVPTLGAGWRPTRRPERVYGADPLAMPGSVFDPVAAETSWPAREILPGVPASLLRESFEGGHPASRIQHVRGLERVEVEAGIQDQWGDDVLGWGELPSERGAR